MRLAAPEHWPAHAVAPGCGLDVVGLEDLPHGGAGDIDTEGGQLTVDSPVPSAGVLPGQPQDEDLDAAEGGWLAGPFRPGLFGVAATEQIAVPAEHRLGETIQWSRASRERGSRCRTAARNARSDGVSRLAGPALQDGQLVTQRQNLDVLVGVTHR